MPPITAQDLLTIVFLVFLEGVLSIDNALVLALRVRPLSPPLRRRALTYGLAGAVACRFLAIAGAAWLLHWTWVKLAGGAYLLYLPFRYWLGKAAKPRGSASPDRSFWRTVLVLELTDLLFAVDSILTAVALTKTLWVIMTGGVLGMLAMRGAASVFVRLLDRFPRFEPTAYLLVLLIGAKLLTEGVVVSLGAPPLPFQDPASPFFWGFWGALFAAFLSGFLPPARKRP